MLWALRTMFGWWRWWRWTTRFGTTFIRIWVSFVWTFLFAISTWFTYATRATAACAVGLTRIRIGTIWIATATATWTWTGWRLLVTYLNDILHFQFSLLDTVCKSTQYIAFVCTDFRHTKAISTLHFTYLPLMIYNAIQFQGNGIHFKHLWHGWHFDGRDRGVVLFRHFIYLTGFYRLWDRCGIAHFPDDFRSFARFFSDFLYRSCYLNGEILKFSKLQLRIH